MASTRIYELIDIAFNFYRTIKTEENKPHAKKQAALRLPYKRIVVIDFVASLVEELRLVEPVQSDKVILIARFVGDNSYHRVQNSYSNPS